MNVAVTGWREIWYWNFLGAFAQLRKAPISFVILIIDMRLGFWSGQNVFSVRYGLREINSFSHCDSFLCEVGTETEETVKHRASSMIDFKRRDIDI